MSMNYEQCQFPLDINYIVKASYTDTQLCTNYAAVALMKSCIQAYSPKIICRRKVKLITSEFCTILKGGKIPVVEAYCVEQIMV